MLVVAASVISSLSPCRTAVDFAIEARCEKPLWSLFQDSVPTPCVVYVACSFKLVFCSYCTFLETTMERTNNLFFARIATALP